jgi:hypothetical protein
MYLLSSVAGEDLSTELLHLVGPMQRDKIGVLLASDLLILQVGKYYLDKKKETEGINHIRHRMRVLSMITISCGSRSLTDALCTQNFNKLMDVARTFKPSTRAKLGGILKKAALMMRNLVIRNKRPEQVEAVNGLIILFDTEWSDRVSSELCIWSTGRSGTCCRFCPLRKMLSNCDLSW